MGDTESSNPQIVLTNYYFSKNIMWDLYFLEHTLAPQIVYKPQVYNGLLTSLSLSFVPTITILKFFCTLAY